jgi:hypothetical protein
MGILGKKMAEKNKEKNNATLIKHKKTEAPDNTDKDKKSSQEKKKVVIVKKTCCKSQESACENIGQGNHGQ